VIDLVALQTRLDFILAASGYVSHFVRRTAHNIPAMTDILDPTVQGLLWVIAIGLTIIVADVFFETEILSVGALLGISVYVSLLFDVDIKWRVLIALLCWLVVTALFYVVWKRFVTPVIQGSFSRGMAEAIDSAVGSTGEFRLIEGKAFVYWNGDLWPVDLDGDGDGSADIDNGRFKDRDKVTIKSVTNGTFTITERIKGQVEAG